MSGWALETNQTTIESAWTVSSNAPTGSWNGLASDSSGTKLIAATSVHGPQVSGIYLSTDAAVTWTNVFISGSGMNEQWLAVASSSDAYTLYAIQQSFGIFYSMNAGKSWTRTIIDSSLYNAYFNSVSCSSNGGSVAVTVSGGSIYVSNNSGYSFTKVTSAGFDSWMFVSMSPSGAYLTAGASSLFTSTNGGYSFAKNYAPSQNWYSVAYSAGSQYAVAAAGGSKYSDYATGGIYMSSDYGATWKLSTGVDTYLEWKAVSIDVTGIQHATAVVL